MSYNIARWVSGEVKSKSTNALIGSGLIRNITQTTQTKKRWTKRLSSSEDIDSSPSLIRHDNENKSAKTKKKTEE